MTKSIGSLLLTFLLGACHAPPGISPSSADMSLIVDGAMIGDGAMTMDEAASDGAASPPAIPYCAKKCTQAADCASDSGAYSSANYQCQAGACVYAGCNSSSECVTTFGALYVCPTTAMGTRYCAKKCTQPADCASDSGAFSGSNYQCTAGACVYSGCTTNSGCVTTFGASYVCGPAVQVPGYPMAVPLCAKGCSQPASCASDSGAYSGANYQCQAGACVYSGCTTNSGCATTFGINYICP
jgi:hypothetical protein